MFTFAVPSGSEIQGVGVLSLGQLQLDPAVSCQDFGAFALFQRLEFTETGSDKALGVDTLFNKVSNNGDRARCGKWRTADR